MTYTLNVQNMDKSPYVQPSYIYCFLINQLSLSLEKHAFPFSKDLFNTKRIELTKKYNPIPLSFPLPPHPPKNSPKE